MKRKRTELLLLALLISGCTVTVGTTSQEQVARVAAEARHSVRRGENLFRISRYYYDTETVAETHRGIERIKRANNMSTEQLSVGQTLVIPGTTKKQPSYPLLPPSEHDLPPIPDDEKSPALPSPEKPPPIIAEKAFIWPLKGTIICSFGELGNQGIDILVAPGTDVFASDTGKVVFAGHTARYQNTVIIKHPNNIYTVYGHDIEILAAQGQEVQRGDRIGRIKSGTHRRRYLHFEIRMGDVAINPLIYLPEQETE